MEFCTEQYWKFCCLAETFLPDLNWHVWFWFLGSLLLFESVCDGLCCCIYPVVVSNIEPESGNAASWTSSHHLGSAKQWEPPGFCAISERHVEQHEGGFNFLTKNAILWVSSSLHCRLFTRFLQKTFCFFGVLSNWCMSMEIFWTQCGQQTRCLSC